jgi:hypothetical protein
MEKAGKVAEVVAVVRQRHLGHHQRKINKATNWPMIS